MTTTPATRLRITARGRRTLAALVAAPVLVLGGLGVLQATTATAGQQAAPVTYETLVVQPGQTLWSIADAIAPEVDPRDVIAEIEDLNGLTGALQPGQTLSIPVEYSS